MRVLVTGGGGFLGTRIVEMCRDRKWEVTALGRGRYIHLENIGVRMVQADIRDRAVLDKAFRGIDLVFHTAALAAIWGDPRNFWDINVQGTQNVLDACRATGVPRLVYTSSPSVIFGGDDLCGADESVPYPAKYEAEYPRTKAEAERRVLAAACSNFATVALRPHLIWGPGDRHLVPRLVARARSGRLRQVGDGSNLVDLTYIDNAASAHLCAADRLPPPSSCNGRAYLVTNGEPVRLWPWVCELLNSLDEPLPQRSVKLSTARAVGTVFELVCRLAHAKSEPPMTRFLATQLAKSHYFSINAARRDLGYEPQVSMAEGLIRFVEWYKASPCDRRTAYFVPREQSPADAESKLSRTPI